MSEDAVYPEGKRRDAAGATSATDRIVLYISADTIAAQLSRCTARVTPFWTRDSTWRTKALTLLARFVYKASIGATATEEVIIT